MAKKLSPQTLLSRLKDDFSYKQLSEATGYSERQLQRIKAGQASGAKAEAAIREFYDLGKRAKSSAVAGESRIKERRERPAKPEPKPEPVEVAAPPPPKKVEVTIKGNLGPSSDPDYIRKRTIRTTLQGDVAAQFAALYEADQFEALQFATSAYFGASGEGHLESVIGTPTVLYTY